VKTTIRRIITHRENTIGGEGKKRNGIELNNWCSYRRGRREKAGTHGPEKMTEKESAGTRRREKWVGKI
jgi:hypothetical protein